MGVAVVANRAPAAAVVVAEEEVVASRAPAAAVVEVVVEVEARPS